MRWRLALLLIVLLLVGVYDQFTGYLGSLWLGWWLAVVMVLALYFYYAILMSRASIEIRPGSLRWQGPVMGYNISYGRIYSVASGKMEQGLLTNKSSPVHIEEVNSNGGEEDTATDGDHSSTAWGFRNFLGVGAEPEEEPEAEVLPVPEGTEDMPITGETLSCDPTGEATCDDPCREEGEREDVYDGETTQE